MAGRGSRFTLPVSWMYFKDGSAQLQVKFGGKWMSTSVEKHPVKGSRAGKWSGWRKRR